MAKKRRPSWQRGAPKTPTSEPQPIRTGASGTVDFDLLQTRNVDGTWDPAQAPRADFAPIRPPIRARRVFPISAGWVSAIVAIVLVVGGAILYVAGLRSDIAVAGAKIDAMQESHKTWSGNLQAHILRVETALEAKFQQLLQMIPGQREPAKPARAK